MDFLIVLAFLQLGFWNRVILLQVITADVLWLWVVIVCLSAPWDTICSPCHSFSFLSFLTRTWNFMNSADVSRKAGCLSYRCTWRMLPVFFCSFTFNLFYLLSGYFMFFVMCAILFLVYGQIWYVHLEAYLMTQVP